MQNRRDALKTLLGVPAIMAAPKIVQAAPLPSHLEEPAFSDVMGSYPFRMSPNWCVENHYAPRAVQEMHRMGWRPEHSCVTAFLLWDGKERSVRVWHFGDRALVSRDPKHLKSYRPPMTLEEVRRGWGPRSVIHLNKDMDLWLTLHLDEPFMVIGTALFWLAGNLDGGNTSLPYGGRRLTDIPYGGYRLAARVW